MSEILRSPSGIEDYHAFRSSVGFSKVGSDVATDDNNKEMT